MLFFVLSLFHLAVAAPDSTSQITCNVPNGIVNVRSTWGAVCKAAAREANVSKVTDFSVFGIGVSGSNGNVINVNPASGTKDSFDFQISVKDATGIFEITNTLGVAPIQITVVDIPTNMTEMRCDPVLNVTSQVNCTLTPRDTTGAQIWAESKIFFMSGVDIGLATGGNIVWQAVTPAVGNYFTVLGTMPYSSVFGITNGVTSQLAQTAALDVPDNTTSMSCVPDVAVPEISPRCTITAKKAGLPIFTSFSAFTAGGVNRGASFGAVRPVGSSFVELGNVFSFDIVIGTSIQSEPFANTGVFPVSNGVSPDFLLTVVADPDSTARLTCESNQVVAGGPLHCTSTPRLQGTQIWSEAAVWVLSAVDILGQTGSVLGSFSSITPLKAGSSFNWTFTPNVVVANQSFPFDVTLNDGRSPIFVVKVVAPELPDATSNMSCAPSVLPLGSSTTCTIYANRNGVAAVVVGNAFTRTDGGNGGTFSPLTPTAGKVFTFTYTPAIKGEIPLSNGRSVEVVTITVEDAVTPSPTAAPLTDAPTAPPAPTAPTAPTTPSAPTPKPPTSGAPTHKPTGKPTARAPTAAQVAAGDESGPGAGVVILIILCVLLVVGAVAFVLYRRQKKKKADHHFNLVDAGEFGYEPFR